MMIQKRAEVQASKKAAKLIQFSFWAGESKYGALFHKKKRKEKHYCLETFQMDSSSACDKKHQSTALPILGSAAAFLNYTAQRFCIGKGSQLHEIRGEGGSATSKRDKTRNHSTTMLRRNTTPQCSPATFNYVDDDQLERG